MNTTPLVSPALRALRPTENRPAASRAFTLIELLTVIAIIGILAAILIPTVSKVRSTAQKARCGSNIRQIGISLINTAQNDRRQQLPRLSGGYMAWDVPRDVALEMMGNAGRDVLYCPSGASNRDELWQTYAYAATQYILLLQTSPLTTSESTFRGIYGKYMSDALRASYTVDGVEIPASRRELAVDAVVRSGPDYTWASPALGNRTNHMNGKLPEGANVVFMDGHVKWRPFAEIKWNKSTGSQTFAW